MSEFIIRDGKGRGFKAGVNEEGCLEVQAITISEMAQVSVAMRQAFEIHPPSFTLLQATGHIPIWWLKNISDNLMFHINRIRFDWNGGSTNFNRTMGFRTYVGMSKPTGNMIEGKFGADVGPHNLNLASNRNPPVEFIYWDGVGTGLAITSFGNQINCGISAQGITFLPYDGALIVPPGAVMGVSLKASDEDGKGACVINGWFA